MDFITADKHLIEASLRRVDQFTKDRHIGIISAHTSRRNGESEGEWRERNDAANTTLKADFRIHDLGYIPIRGRFVYRDKVTDDLQAFEEYSFLVNDGTDPGPENFKHLKTILTKLGHKFQQYAVIHKGANDEDCYLISTHRDDADMPFGGRVSIGKWHPNRLPEFQSYMKGMQWGGLTAVRFFRGDPLANFAVEGSGYELVKQECRFEYYQERSFFSRKEVLF